jgi:hypothetical protein
MSPAYHADLYPLGREWGMLRSSFARYGFMPEHPLVARALGSATGKFEIVCGIGRFTIAIERGMKRVPIVIRSFNDTEARDYSIESNIYAHGVSATISLVHTLALARSIAAADEIYSPKQMCEHLRVSESTYWRAVACLDYTLATVRNNYPLIDQMELHRQVAEIIRRDLLPDFTKLFADQMEVNTFHKLYCYKSDIPSLKKRTSKNRFATPQSTEKSQASKRKIPLHDNDARSPLSTQYSVNGTYKGAKTLTKKQREGRRKESRSARSQPLLDLLPDES